MEKTALAMICAAALSCFLCSVAFVPGGQPRLTPSASLRAEGAQYGGSSADFASSGTAACVLLSVGCTVALGAMSLRSRPTAAQRPPAVVRCAYNAANEIGACDPLLFWDPIGFCESCTKEEFDRRRAVELKHGRLCMLAAVGMVWPDIFGKFDGYLSPSAGLKFADVPSGLYAVSAVPVQGLLQILLFAGVVETQLFKDPALGGFGLGKYGAEPGNFGTGYWGRKIKDPAERRLKLTTELNNGRLAMIAVTAMLVQNGLTGQSTIEQLVSGHISPFNDGQGVFAVAAPRRAYDASRELGACPPLGYWDPFGMMAFQDKAKFDRNRELELKHGRVCMVATIGMVAPDLFGRLPGYLSPSSDLKFADVPSTIEAVYKVPLFGWLQIFAFVGALEAKNLAFPTNYGYPPFLGNVNKLTREEKKGKLLAEINNGRLAMMAFAAMVVQSGVTGQSLVEQFSSGNLNPFVGGYARHEAGGSTALRATAQQSASLPWAPCPDGLKNDIFGDYVGDVGFDPLGFAKNRRLLPWYREAELAHGRVCMLAVLGFSIQTAGVKFEPFVTRYPTDSLDPLKAATQVPIVGWLQILAVITLSELWRYENVISKYGSGIKPGDLGWNPAAPVNGPRPKWFGPTFTSKYNKSDWDQMRLREMKHCRLAMFGFGFMVVENAASGRGVGLIPAVDKPEYAGTVGDFIPKGL